MAKTIIPFRSKGKKIISTDGAVEDHGKLGSLDYEVFKRGVIHIFNKNYTFKKDCEAFEDELDKHDFASAKEDDKIIIQGSGDNDHLVFTVKDGDIVISLEPRGFEMMKKLMGILKCGKKRKKVS